MPFVGTADAAYWTVAGFADATGDGQADILWRGAAGETYLWSLEGGTLLATPFVGMADAGDWTVAGFADATGDGQADILWRGAAGDTYLWTLDGGRVSSMPFVGSADAAAWTVAGFADATGDGKADILWRGADGQVFLWGLDGSTVNEMRFLGTGEPGAVIAAFADATGDGRADVLFQGQPGASPVWDVAPAAEPTSAAPFASLAEAPADPTEAAGLVAVGAPVYAAGSRVLTVGADKQYQTVGAAVGASRDGDVLLVDAGRYVNDFAVVRTKIAILAVGGRVEMVATVPPPNWKGILTVQADCRIEGIDFSGARIPDEYGHNGAGIRLEGGALSLFNTAFRGNQNGILTNNTAGLSITIDQSLFDGNGGRDGGKGNIHNIYIGHIDAATVTNSVFQNALVGHEFKSRAAVNTLTNNLFVSGVGAGTGSYNVDLPDGGRAVLTGNTFVKGTGAENPNMVHFGGEGIPYAGSSLTMNDNRFVSSNGSAIGLLNHTSVTAVLSGTVLDGLAPESFLRGPARATGTTDAGGQAVADTTLVGVLPGQTTIFDDAADHSIVIDGTRIKAVQGGAGRLTVQADAGHIVVIGGSGGLDLTEAPGSGGSRYATAAGSRNRLAMLGVGQNLVDSQGTDLIIAGDGNQTAQLNGDATVVGGRGNSTWAVNGTASIDTGSGSATITLGSTARLSLTGVNDHYRLSTSGGTATFDTTNAGRRVAGSIVGGATDMQVYDGVMRIDTAAGGAGAVLRLDHGGAKVRSAGADEIHAGTGANTVIVSGRAKVFAGTGTLEVYSHGFTGAEIFGRGGTYVIDGDGGGMTYHGGDLASTVDLRLSRITLRGGAGHMTVNGGMSETIIGGAGGITVNERGGGGNSITTQAGSTNLLALSNAGRVTSHGRDTITSAGGNQVIDTYGDATVVLGAGNSQIGVYGRATLTAGAGSNRVTVGRGADASIEARDLTRVSATGGTTRLAFKDGGQAASVTTSGGSAYLSAEPGNGIGVSTDPSLGPVDIVAGGGPIGIDSRGADTIHLGSGPATVTLRGSGSETWAGSGPLVMHGWDPAGGNFTLHGGDGSIMLDQGRSTMRFIGGAGAATLTGGKMDIIAGSGDLVVGGAQVRSFQGGTGRAELFLNNEGSNITFGGGTTVVHATGSWAANVFELGNSKGGVGIIDNFRPGTDRAILGGAAIATQEVRGGSAHVVLTNGVDVTFRGVTDLGRLFG